MERPESWVMVFEGVNVGSRRLESLVAEAAAADAGARNTEGGLESSVE